MDLTMHDHVDLKRHFWGKNSHPVLAVVMDILQSREKICQHVFFSCINSICIKMSCPAPKTEPLLSLILGHHMEGNKKAINKRPIRKAGRKIHDK